MSWVQDKLKLMMEQITRYLTDFLDTIFFSVISPVFSVVGSGLELMLLAPLRLIQLPVALQVTLVAVLTALVSLRLRQWMRVEEKEEAFRMRFQASKEQQQDLKLISDWKSRETYAKTIDDEIDQEFNTYLAGRFVRYGVVYLLPLFLTQFWLGEVIDDTFVLVVPTASGPAGLSQMAVFLFCYCLTLFIAFRRLKRKKKTQPKGVADGCAIAG